MPRSSRDRRRTNAGAVAVAYAALQLLVARSAHADAPPAALADLTLDQLSRLEVTSVSKVNEPLRDAPASIYVITHDDIVRSGATSLVQALRLAPNLLISQYGSSYFVAGARGLGGAQEAQNFSNKLLVLIDGRSVYTPLFSGVYFDVQDVVMDDIERIEVISGPGATLWGANAMHGVINVITRPAYLTDSTSITVGLGDEDRVASARLGYRASETLSYRIYGTAQQRGETELADGSGAGDNWHNVQFGGRLDRIGASDTLTLQGDVYRGDRNLDVPGGNTRAEGANVLVRWQRDTGRSGWQVQGYYDYTSQAAPGDGVAFRLHTFDFELQNRQQLGRHRVVWGAGARINDYEIDGSAGLDFDPAARTLTLGNVFFQDTVRLAPTLDLTFGLKAEHDSFSGWNLLPDLRVSWEATANTIVWGAASRSIRSPTPFDSDVVERIGDIVYLRGNPDFRPEQVDTFELGLRGQPAASFTYSASVFYNVYDDLRTIEPASQDTRLPYHWGNKLEGATYGVEAWAKWQVSDWWRLSPGVRLMRFNLEPSPGASELLGPLQAGNDPESQALLASAMSFGANVTLDATLRYVGSLPDPKLDAYQELDVSLGWHAMRALDLRLTGYNLLDSRHLEYPAPSGRYVRRSLLAQVRWQF